MIKHLSYFVPFTNYKLLCKPDNPLLAIFEIAFYSIDIIGIPTLLEIIGDWARWSTRTLNNDEIELSKLYYENSINYDLVRVFPKAKYTASKFAIAYVSFNTINYWKPISRPIFVHEMMHVWQYQQLGSVYILKALYAQAQGNAYDYGGAEALFQGMTQGRSLFSFNLEQQAEIFQDYCQMRESEVGNPMNESIYGYYVREIL